jgi:protein-arginine kinase activator protein McsA
MRCQKCQQRDALVHLTQREGNREDKVSICDQCAAELGLNDPQSMPLASILSLLREHGQWKQPGSEPLDG